MKPHLAVALATFVTMASPCWAGQTASSATKSRPGPRMPDGQPDLQGIWTNATVTPLERPAELAGKDFFTPAEAAVYEKQDRRAKQCGPSRPYRRGRSCNRLQRRVVGSKNQSGCKPAHVADHRPTRWKNTAAHARSPAQSCRPRSRQGVAAGPRPRRSIVRRPLHRASNGGTTHAASRLQQQLSDCARSRSRGYHRRDDPRYADHFPGWTFTPGS